MHRDQCFDKVVCCAVFLSGMHAACMGNQWTFILHGCGLERGARVGRACHDQCSAVVVCGEVVRCAGANDH
jgi:hypothetical protein